MHIVNESLTPTLTLQLGREVSVSCSSSSLVRAKFEPPALFVLHVLVRHRFWGARRFSSLLQILEIEGGSHLLVYVPCLDGCAYVFTTLALAQRSRWRSLYAAKFCQQLAAPPYEAMVTSDSQRGEPVTSLDEHG